MDENWSREAYQRRAIAQTNAHEWRMKTLRPEAAKFWIDILDRAESIAGTIPKTRPCDYAPWTTALAQIAESNKYWVTQPVYELSLMEFAKCTSAPVWPDKHAHLVDFVIRFLEADVMMFRSGYTKKHLLKRLRQASLNVTQTERIHALLKRVVVDGTGLEEFREFCRLAAHVMSDDLRVWLTEHSSGVFISLEERYGPDTFDWINVIGEDKLRKIGMIMFMGRPEYYFAYEPPHTIAKRAELPKDNLSKLNAWRMLMHLKRTET